MDKLKMHSPNLTQENIRKIMELFPNCVTEVKGTTEYTEHTEKDENAKNNSSVSSVCSVVKYAIDFDQLKQELSESIVEGPQERYQLNWPGKREALLTANAPIAKTLRPCREESVDFDTTKNLFIEGDNLDALKLLQETYLGKVKMIYIDPPYNTGNDFIYEDDFAENAEEFLKRSNQKDEEGNRLIANTEANGRFHSDWLTMIYPRLKLARNLLSDDGIICVSADENEIHNLKQALVEIFGGANCLGIIANVNNPKGRSDDKFIATSHEYIAVFAKDHALASVYGFEPDEIITKRYNKVDDRGRKYRDMDLRKTGDADRRVDRQDMYYFFYYNEKSESLRVSKEPDSKEGEIEITPQKDDGTDGRWRWGFDTAKQRIEDVYAKFMPNRQIWGVFEKDYLDGRPPVKSTSTWTFKDVNSERGSEQFLDLGFGKEVFQRPKPIGTMKRVLEIGTVPHKESIVLDFFAGSGTLAQAALQLNSSGKRNIHIILVQLPEPCDEKSEAFKAGYKTIAEISKERIRRAGKKVLEEMEPRNTQKKENQESLFGEADPSVSSVSSVVKNLDIGFRVLKIDSSNMADVYYTPDTIDQTQVDAFVDNIKPDRKPEDLLFQVLLDWGVDLSLPIRKTVITTEDTENTESKKQNSSVSSVSSVVKNYFEVFFVDENALVACFDTGVNEELVKELAGFEPLRVVFRDNGFMSDAVKINVEQIFKQMSPGTEVKAI